MIDSDSSGSWVLPLEIIDVAADVAKDVADLVRLLDVLQERGGIGAVAAGAVGGDLS